MLKQQRTWERGAVIARWRPTALGWQRSSVETPRIRAPLLGGLVFRQFVIGHLHFAPIRCGLP